MKYESFLCLINLNNLLSTISVTNTHYSLTFLLRYKNMRLWHIHSVSNAAILAFGSFSIVQLSQPDTAKNPQHFKSVPCGKQDVVTFPYLCLCCPYAGLDLILP